MTLQLALLVLGIAALVLIMCLSYLRWRPNRFRLNIPVKALRSIFVFPTVTRFQLLRARFPFSRGIKRAQREPSLVSAADFELGGNPISESDEASVSGQQDPDRDRGVDLPDPLAGLGTSASEPPGDSVRRFPCLAT